MKAERREILKGRRFQEFEWQRGVGGILGCSHVEVTSTWKEQSVECCGEKPLSSRNGLRWDNNERPFAQRVYLEVGQT